MNIRVYLCGSIKKGIGDPRPPISYWTQSEEEYIRKNIPNHEVVLLNPANTKIKRNDYLVNYGCDLHLISTSDVVLCDARTEKGLGIGAELMFCRFREIPVITWAPQNSHYRREHLKNINGEDLHDWIHPFVFGLSDYIVESLAEAVQLIRIRIETGELQIKKPTTEYAIEYFNQQYQGKSY